MTEKNLNPQLEFKKLLQAELDGLQSSNPAYSLRAYAQRLDIYPSTLSEILSGKRLISSKMAQKILPAMNLDPEKSKALLSHLQEKTFQKKKDADNSTTQKDFVQMNMDQLHVISEWHYFAILSLADTDDFQEDSQWVAQRLNISPQKAKSSLERLERLELLERKDGKLKATGLQFKTETDVANISLRKHHYQNLELAKKSLDKDSLEERDFTFMNMAVDPERIPEMKKRIKDFRREFCEEFESKKKKEVYKFCLQLFPLTKSEEKK